MQRKTIIAMLGLLAALASGLAGCSGGGGGNGGNVPADTSAPAGVALSGLPPTSPSAGLGTELAGDPGLEQPYANGFRQVLYSSGTGGFAPAQSGDVHSGSKAQQLQLSVPGGNSVALWTGSGSGAIAPAAHSWYRVSLWAKRVSGNAGDVAVLGFMNGLPYTRYMDLPITSPTWKQYTYTMRAEPGHDIVSVGITNEKTASPPPSDTVIIDDLSVRTVPVPSLMSLKQSFSSSGKAFAALTMQAGTQAGIVFCADSGTNPRNYLLYYHDGGSRIRLVKCLNGVYSTIVSLDSVHYVPGASLNIMRYPGSDQFSIFYNQGLITTATITDPAIINNTIHGIFNTFEGNTADFSFSPVTSQKTVVYLGGSITSGVGASATDVTSWQYLLRHYLDNSSISIQWNHIQAGVGGTDSFYSLIRLQSDVLSYAPDIVFIDQAVNDCQLVPNSYGWPYLGEAVVRRIRTAYPGCKIVVLDLMQPNGSDIAPSATTESVRNAWIAIANHYGCDLYRFDTAIQAALGGNPTYAQIHDATTGYFMDAVHPNDRGHALIFNGIKNQIDLLAANQWTGKLSDYPRLGATADFESPPTILKGVDMLTNLATGTWTQPGNGAIASSVAGSTITYTGPMLMVGLDVALQNGTWPQGMQYSLDGGGWGPVPGSYLVPDSEFLYLAGPRAVHTLSIRLNSGTAQINRILIL